LILIHLSKRFISFRYYVKGNDGLAPLGDPIMPLAIYCSGTDIEISKIARQQAQKGVNFYYDDIFSYMKRPGTFSFRGEEVSNHKMLLYAIERMFDVFFTEKLYNRKGRIEENRNTLPVCFIFDPELDKNDRNFVLGLFKDAGYNNVITIDDGKTAVGYLHNNLASGNYVVLTISEPLLYGRIYDRNGLQIASSIIGEIEANPKEERLCKLIFDEIQKAAYGYNYRYEDQRPAIMQVVKVLRNKAQYQRGTGYIDGNVVLSDGINWNFEVDACDIANASTDSVNTRQIDIFLSNNNIIQSDTSLILIGQEERIDELYNNFSSSYKTIEFESEILFEQVLKQIIGNPRFFISPENGNVLKQVPNKYKNEVEQLLQCYKNRTDYEVLALEVNDLLRRLQAEGIRSYDTDLDQILEYVKDHNVGQTKEDPSKYRREVIRLTRSYKMRADYDALQQEVNDLLNRMHADNVHDFDADLQKVIEYSKSHVLVKVNPKKYQGEKNRLSRGYKHRTDYGNLLKEAKDLLNRMHGDYVHDYDAEIDEVIEFAQKNLKTETASAKTKTAIPKSRTATNSKDNGSSKSSTQLASNNNSASTNDAKYRRDVNILMRGYEKRADKDKLRLEVEELLKKMHEDGVFSFDEKLNKVLSFSKSAAANSGNGTASKRSSRASKPSPSSAPNSSDPDDLKKKATTKVIKPTKPDATSRIVIKKTQSSNKVTEPTSDKAEDAQATVAKTELRKSITASQSAGVTQKLPTKPLEANKLVLKDKKSLIGKSIDSNDMKFKVGSDGDVSVCLTKCKGDIVVPPTIEIEGTILFVTSVVKGGMFSTCTNVRSISLPETIVSLENFAFTYAAISSIDLPERLKKVGDYAFNGCKNLTELDLPDSVVKVGDHAFDGCKNLKRIQFHGKEFWNDSISGCKALETIRFTCAPPTIKGKVDSWQKYFDIVELHVPDKFAVDYKKDPIWSRFKVIKSYNK